VYTQNKEQFYAQFPYGLQGTGVIEGQPGLFYIGPNEAFYAGCLDSEMMLIVSEQEVSAAWEKAVEQIRGEHYFPYGEENEPEDLYRQAIYQPAWDLVKSISYWLSQ